MAKVTWLGEGDSGPEETIGFNGVVFKKGQAVEVPDNTPWLETAKTNQYFKVVEGSVHETHKRGDDEPKTKGKM